MGLRQDGCGGDVGEFSVALDDAGEGNAGERLETVAVDGQKLRPGIEPPRGEVHPLDRGIENVDLVDAGGRDLLDGPGYRFAFDDRP